MKIVKLGISRTVILIGNYAIKLPNCRYQHDHFLLGCYCNYKERQYTKQANRYKDNTGFFTKIVPTIFCSWFGLISIQKRVEPLCDELTDEQWNEMSRFFSERKKENYGYFNNKLVCVDYGQDGIF